MKKIKYIVALFVIFISMNSNVFGNFDIQNYNIDATLMNNGDLFVKEKLEYSTNETRNGVYREIDISNPNNKLNSADEFELYGVLVDGVNYKNVESASNGQEGIFEYGMTEEDISIKVFAPFKNTGRVVEYKYLLKNVAVKYNDVGEIYWNFIGDKWQDEIKNLNIKIELPGAMRQDEVYVFGHGSDNGTFKKLQNNVIILTAKDITPGQQVDARVIFPSTVISESQKIGNKNMLEKIIRKKTYRKKNSIILESLKVNIIKYKNEIGMFSIFLSIVLIIWSFNKNKGVRVEKLKYFREIPDNLEPAILGRIYDNTSNGRHFWATFFDLVRKKIYKISKVMDEQNKEQYIVEYIGDGSDSGLKNFEQKTTIYINKCIGDDKEIDLGKLNTKIIKKMQTTRNFSNWEEDVKSNTDLIIGEVPKKDSNSGMKWLAVINVLLIIAIIVIYSLVSEDPSIAMGVVMFYLITSVVYTIFIQSFGKNTQIAILMFFCVHFLGFQAALYALANAAEVPIMYLAYLSGYIALNYIFKNKLRSPKEIEILAKLKGLKKYITDFSLLKEKDIEYINLWQQYLIMAIMFRLPKKILKRICENLEMYSNSEENLSIGLIRDYTMFSSMNSNFNSNSYHSAGSSYSGSSGDFSGGGSSGGGGRWWPVAVEVSKNNY